VIEKQTTRKSVPNKTHDGRIVRCIMVALFRYSKASAKPRITPLASSSLSVLCGRDFNRSAREPPEHSSTT